jgi:hypothetical protein
MVREYYKIKGWDAEGRPRGAEERPRDSKKDSEKVKLKRSAAKKQG